MIAREFNMHCPNIQKDPSLRKLAFADKGHLCRKSDGLGCMSFFWPSIIQKLIGRVKNFD